MDFNDLVLITELSKCIELINHDCFCVSMLIPSEVLFHWTPQAILKDSVKDINWVLGENY